MGDQKSSPDWLPSGWTMELKVRRDGRKDKYYTDPVSGCVFRSMKDVLRYVKTGNVGRLASKPKDKGNSNMELEDDKTSPPAVAEGQKLADSGINQQIIENQSLKLAEVVKEEQNLESTCTGDCIPLSEHTSDQCMEGDAVNSVDLPESKDLKQGGSSDSTISSVSAHVVGALPEKQQLEDGVGRHRKRKIQRGLNKMKEPQLPRRASKRLAGIEVNPPIELKTNNRARRGAARRSDEAGSTTGENFGKLITQEENAGKREADNKVEKKQECPVVLSPKNPSIPEEHVGLLETNHEANEKPGSSPDLYSDPCIDFAIKTLTGAIPIEDENKADGNPCPNRMEDDNKADENPCNHNRMEDDNKADENPCNPNRMEDNNKADENPCNHNRMEDDNKADENPCNPNRMEDNNKADENPSCRVDSWTDPCIEFAIKTLTGAIPIGDESKAEDNMDFTCGDLWTDPCIEFAVKTLTGAIPVGDDLSLQNYFLQQPSSSETQGTNGLKLQNVGLDFCHTDFLCQQLHTEEKPLLKQQESVTSNLPNTGNVSLENSGGGGLPPTH